MSLALGVPDDGGNHHHHLLTVYYVPGTVLNI